MILAPTNGPIGIQPHGSNARMVYKSSTAATVGTVVCLDFSQTYPPTTLATMESSMFATCVRAVGNSGTVHGPIGVVVDLLDGAGAQNTYVIVQFGGIVKANVTSGTGNAVSKGNALGVADAGGVFGTAANSTSVYPAAIALEAVAAATSTTINVLLNPGYFFNADI